MGPLLLFTPRKLVFGGFAFTLYPLSMAYTCEKAKENQLVSVTGGFVLAYGIGAIAGPLLAPLAMDFFGVVGLFYFLGAISLALGVVGCGAVWWTPLRTSFLRSGRDRATPLERRCGWRASGAALQCMPRKFCSQATQ